MTEADIHMRSHCGHAVIRIGREIGKTNRAGNCGRRSWKSPPTLLRLEVKDATTRGLWKVDCIAIRTRHDDNEPNVGRRKIPLAS